jgi:uncharacterized protein (TIGR02391 family)
MVKMRLEQLEGLVKKIRHIQSIMEHVSTGGSLIQEREDEYIVTYLDITTEVENLAKAGLTISHTNSFRTLWDWYGYWSSKLPSYESRRQYIRELYAPLLDPIESALHRHRMDKTPLGELIRDLAKRIAPIPEPAEEEFQMSFEWLHPKIVQRCHIPFEKGEFDDAIFNAMEAVEEGIRVKISADSMDTGLGLISRAMNPKSPLLTFSRVNAEQEAAHSLYRGAIGSLKSPLGHRFLDSSDPVNTFECLALGSLLMRMLDGAM